MLVLPERPSFINVSGMRIFRFLADFRFLHGQFGHSCNLYRSAIKKYKGGSDVWSFTA